MSVNPGPGQDLYISLCAVLMAEACNIRLEPLIKHNIPALTRHRLSWVKQNYLGQNKVSANARLIDFFQSTLSLLAAGVVAKWRLMA